MKMLISNKLESKIKSLYSIYAEDIPLDGLMDFYNSLDIDRKRFLIELILKDPKLL